MKELLDRIESCNYQCDAGDLRDNADWKELRRLVINPIQEMWMEEFKENNVPVFNEDTQMWEFHCKPFTDPLDQPDAE